METCEIYFTCMHYQGQNWLDNPDILLRQVYNNLNEIRSLNFNSISLNMAQVYNVSLKSTNYDSMVMFIKGIKLNGVQFFDFESTKKLEASIKQQLSYIEGLYFQNMEIRTSSSYSDVELGIVVPLRAVLKPTILEQTRN